ncbi:mdl [Wigglesworthia glossinidia endosymbiont of Glossina brevipalpis]|uniref:Multidrug resistance-like ATP-binding protein MdlA n=1 Tax=Wigglesworthia glossinidia brevipalpis TaxID=36870 RepID=Q8D2Y2_WIGBR|nr:mdl [Wigglesworthia glossinidia endosymbiont of Glossina brevipalpis]
MKFFLKLKWFFIREKKQYFLSIILLIIIAMLKLISPWAVGIIVDDVINLRSTNISVIILVVLIIVSSILVYYIRYIWRIILFGSAYQLSLDLRDKFYFILSNQSPSFYIKNKTGDLISRVTSDVDRVVYAVGEGVLTLVDSLIMGFSVLLIMSIKINIILTIFALTPMPIMVFLIKKIGKKLYNSVFIYQNEFSKLNNKTHENLNNIKTIKSFGSEKYYLSCFSSSVFYANEKNMHSEKIDAKFDPIIYLTVGISNLLAIYGGIYLIYNEIITIGQLTSFIMYLGLMIWPMLAFAWTFNIIERGHAAYNRINLILEKKNNKDGDISIPDKNGIILVSIKKFIYPYSKNIILKNIKIKINPGKFIGICGPTGSGKSTLVSLILRYFDIIDGEIFFKNLPLKSLILNDWRNLISVVNQSPFLFSDSIKNNISLGNPNAKKNEIEKVAELACIHNDIINFPKNYKTKIGENGLILSGGQKQRIAIARALLIPSKILILDDPLSSIDSCTGNNILNNIKKFKNHKTIIMISNKLSSIKEASEILVLINGRINQRGNHNFLLRSKGWYYKMYKYQKIENYLVKEKGK